jgi:DNA polymerase (family X)
MTNKEIAKTFQFLGDIMELHGENPFKIRSYQNAYLTLRKLDRPLAEMPQAEVSAIKGIGPAISEKIRELLDHGTMKTLTEYQAKTPEGVQEMLHIKGFGPKKIAVIWKDLGVETIGELYYAVNENRLLDLKGFGQKTQEELRKQLEYFLKTRNQFHFASLEADAEALEAAFKSQLPGVQVALTGATRRQTEVLEAIEILLGTEQELSATCQALGITIQAREDKIAKGVNANEYPVILYQCAATEFGTRQFERSATPDFLQAFLQKNQLSEVPLAADEEAIFANTSTPVIPAYLREEPWALEKATPTILSQIIRDEDLRGIVHNHSTYSDGIHSLADMAEYTRASGYEYLVMSDHSKSAFYANGLQPERVLQQMEEIDRLNAAMAPFKVFKSIESDILNDGSLDYEPALLAKFDLVIASVHSNLRMDLDKATNRVIKAIENPFTRILGHPTGRLLLSRPGYPLDHQKIIDACAANGVVIELNASPYRLDLDWRWIPYALEKGVMISINPDAHSREAIHQVHYGVLAARKGLLSRNMCLNAKNLQDFEAWIGEKR